MMILILNSELITAVMTLVKMERALTQYTVCDVAVIRVIQVSTEGRVRAPFYGYMVLAIILPVLPIISLLHFWPQVTSNPNFVKKNK